MKVDKLEMIEIVKINLSEGMIVKNYKVLFKELNEVYNGE